MVWRGINPKETMTAQQTEDNVTADKATKPEKQPYDPTFGTGLTDTTRRFLLPKKRYTFSRTENGEHRSKTMDNWVVKLDPTDEVDKLVIAHLEKHPQAKDIDKLLNPPADRLFDVMSELSSDKYPIDCLIAMLNASNILAPSESAYWRHVADKTKLVGKLLKLTQTGD